MLYKSIKLKKTDSILKDLISEALMSLDEGILAGICVSNVDCSKGKYDAKVYMEDVSFTKNQKVDILNCLNKSKTYIRSYCFQRSKWYRFPSLSFEFDNSLRRRNDINSMLSKLQMELSKVEKK